MTPHFKRGELMCKCGCARAQMSPGFLQRLESLRVAFGKPMIVSTGMNDIPAIRKTVKILRCAKVPFALLHCTSVYPTPYDKVRLGSLSDLQRAFPDAVIGLSDHSLGNYTCLGAVALGASILEKHFTSKKSWPGPDVPISIDPGELRDLTSGANAVFAARGGNKTILRFNLIISKIIRLYY